MTRRRLLAALGASVSLAVTTASGCGEDAPEAVPPAVDVALAPERIGADLALYENTDEATLAAFRNAGDRSLASDGHIWELRRADRLIGTLQITTVLPKIDLTDPEDRRKIVSAVIPGSPLLRRVAGVEVHTYEIDDRATFVWFAEGLYQVLQLKDREIKDYETVLAEILRHQVTISSFKPLTE